MDRGHSRWMGRVKGQRKEGENGASVSVAAKLVIVKTHFLKQR